MPTTAQINAQSPGAFTATEIEQIADIANIFLGESLMRCDALIDAAQQQAMRADIAIWDSYENDTVGVKGGPKGVDYSKVRDREWIKRSVRRRLGLPAIDPNADPDAMKLFTIYPLEWIATNTSEEV